MPAVQQLLLVDFDGQPVTDPDDVITAAVEDPRYLDRVAPLAALLAAPDTPPWDRFLACYALTSWAEPAGYAGTLTAARDPDQVPWIGVSIDRRTSVDDTFAQLAGAAGSSADFSQAKGTEPDRIEVIRALVAISTDHFFDWQLAFALDSTVLPQVHDDVIRAVESGVAVLAGGDSRPFDLPTQLADLAAALTTVDEPVAAELGHRIAAVAPDSYRTLDHLTAIVSRGRGKESLALGEYLGLIGSAELRDSLAEALAERGT